MPRFDGFPPGTLKATPIPDLFFSRLLPEISDLAELKVTLHLFWLVRGKRGFSASVTWADLRADRTLYRSLQCCGEADEALRHGLSLAMSRGTILAVSRGGVTYYFLNTAQARTFAERASVAAVPLPPPQRPALPPAPDRGEKLPIYDLYEHYIGFITPTIAQELRTAAANYPAQWIEEAFALAAEKDRRSWRYVRGILRRWEAEGRSPG